MTHPLVTRTSARTDAVYIGRGFRYMGFKRSIWANPLEVDKDGTREEVIEMFREYLLASPELMARLPELRGKVLMCHCSPDPCHGEVLAELANREV